MLYCLLGVVLGLVALKCIDYVFRLPYHRIKSESASRSRRCVLVTGCGAGFGLKLVERCALRDCVVFAACRTAASAEHLKEIYGSNSNVKPFVMDINDEESVAKGLHYVSEHLPPEGLWALVNNAGISSARRGPLDWVTVEDYRQVMEVNVLGTIRVTKTFLPLIKRTRGRIVNMTSIAGRIAAARMGPYCASKFALEAFSDSLRQEVSVFGVSVHIIEPGRYKTAMTEKVAFAESFKQSWQSLPQATRDEYGEHYLDAVMQRATKDMAMSSERVDEVIDAYEHAILAWFPRFRYVIGKSTGILCVLSHLPEWITDAVMMKMAALPPPAAVLGNSSKKHD